jgi:hypothetical protein
MSVTTQPGQTPAGTSTTMVPVASITAVRCVTPSTGVSSTIAWVAGAGLTTVTTLYGTYGGLVVATAAAAATAGAGTVAYAFFVPAGATLGAAAGAAASAAVNELGQTFWSSTLM